MAAGNLRNMTDTILPGVSSQLWGVIVAGILLPGSFARTMKEAFWASLFGVLGSVLAVFVIVALDVTSDNLSDGWRAGNPTIESVAGAFSDMIFALSGHSIYPAVQRVMPDERQFSLALMLAMPVVMSLYLIVSTVSYYTYGCEIPSNILLRFPKNAAWYIVMGAITLTVTMAYAISMNPVFHTVEHALRIGFGKHDDEESPAEASNNHTQSIPVSVAAGPEPPDAPVEQPNASADANHAATEEIPMEPLGDAAHRPSAPADGHDGAHEEPPHADPVTRAASSLHSDSRSLLSGQLVAKYGTSVPATPPVVNEMGFLETYNMPPPAPLFLPHRPYTLKERLASYGLRMALVGFTLFMAELLPFFGDILSLLGASTISAIAVILPSWFYLRLFRQTLGRIERTVCRAILCTQARAPAPAAPLMLRGHRACARASNRHRHGDRRNRRGPEKPH